MNTKQVTIKELSEMLGEEYLVTSALVKFLVNHCEVKEVGKRPAEGGRGKPSSVFEIPNEITLVFWNEEASPLAVSNETDENKEVTPTPATPEDLNIEVAHVTDEKVELPKVVDGAENKE